jgi:Concanavalin A-like lectin/glucanases superfamily
MSVRTTANNQVYTRLPGTFTFIPQASMPFMTNFSVGLWAKCSVNRGTTTTIFGLRDSGGTGNAIAIGSTNGVAVMLETASTDTNMITMVVGSWYWFGATCSLVASQLVCTAYWTPAGGGTLSTATATDTTVTASDQADSMWLGSDVSGNFFNGDLQYVKIWDAILTQAELQNEVFHGQPQRTDNLNAFYPLLAANTPTDPTGTINAGFPGNQNNVYVNTAAAATEGGPPCSWI